MPETTGDDTSYGYDDGGRLTDIIRHGDDWDLEYNAAGQVTTIVRAGTSNLSYQHDALGRRTQATNGATTTNSLIAPAAQRLGAGALDVEQQHLATNGSGQLLQGWIYAGENPILRFDDAGNVEYYLESANDSIAALVNSSAGIVAEYEFDAFGNSLNGVNPTGGAGGDFGFHAAWREDATGLYHMRARTYDPETGRFTSVDPAEPNQQVPESYHPYSFANNNPHLYSDPTGLFSITEINVSGAIQSSLNGLRNALVNQARRYAIDTAEEFAVDFLVDQLALLLPAFGVADPRPLIAAIGAGDVGKIFESSITKNLERVLPFDGLWIEPTVAESGEVRNAGINKNNPLGFTTFTTPGAKPDYIINRTNPSDESAERSWLVGDIKLSANRLYLSYVKPGDQTSQWNAIVNHAKNYGLNISLFFTFYEGGSHVGPALRQLIGKEALKNGAVVFIISLKD